MAPSAVISMKLEALTDHFAPLRSKRIGADSTPRNVPTSPDIVRGRSFTAAERDGEQPVAIVSESIARQLWPNSSGVGGTFRLEQDPGPGTRPKDEPPMPARLVTVVGVSHDVAGFRIIDTREAGIFLPTSVNVPKTSIAARVKGDSALTQRTLVDRLARIDQNLGMVVTMRTLARLETFFLQIAFWVSLVLGGLALLLTVSSSQKVTRLILAQTTRPVVYGLLAGVALAASLATLVIASPAGSTITEIVRVTDPIAYVSSLLLIVAACLFAAWIPATRAARLDPMQTLRQE